ncbi:hypothetical protein GCG54_00011306 [Colletotrichum gloeosporioides]|uniref:Uncharacterized protein n=1 Tax=Colletotrichum gloeosporioides TaxID=474922 RepID=A0A8H4CS20_COLGL|nr:uncharacterized protein GCG54_00011306 [Colletotrichum gloeosporioides]KAF3809110.1 hypothetical protein GCG54_00011306 [Colletotrichum gloeosporioides]
MTASLPTNEGASRCHRLLAPLASVDVTPICLGGADCGEAWKDRLGTCSNEVAFDAMDYFHEQDGNLIATYPSYWRCS